MYKKILVPLDGSGLAEKALSHAKTMSTACGPAEIDLMFVVQPIRTDVRSAYSTEEKDYFAQSDKKAEAWGQDYLAKVAQNLKRDDITAKSVVLKGKPAEKILDYAVKNAVDLIVMSTHGRSGPARWALGSVAEKVTQYSTVPVLIIR